MTFAEVQAALRAIATDQAHPLHEIAMGALGEIGSVRGAVEVSKNANERLRREVADLKQQLKAHDNRTYHAEKRVNEMWRLVNDARAVILRAEAAIPIEQREALEVIEKFLARSEPPATPAQETK